MYDFFCRNRDPLIRMLRRLNGELLQQNVCQSANFAMQNPCQINLLVETAVVCTSSLA